MKHYSKHLVIWLCVASLSLSACQQLPQNTANMTPEEKLLREQVTDYNDTVLVSCAAGGVLGGVLGQVLGGDTKSTLIGAGVGTALGCGVGTAAGNYKQEAEQKDIALDDTIRQAQKENAQLKTTIATADKVIMADEQKIARLRSQITKGEITREQAEKNLASVDNNIAYLNGTIDKLKNRQQQWRLAANKAHTSNPLATKQIDKEVDTLNKQIAHLEASLKKLINQRQVSLT